ncbi:MULTISPECIES: PhzF family phenazine biosynthesis protein [unclassified Ruegeria]|uniref:PhzF family phenazine biosynthesis protein n=1 Tax=unclassified Ruegeria TaxID=2625375 RepID=UPI00148964E8|nr:MULTISPECIES: PhzF family phenazine biosynthesis protein [unclassified Ruegeria]NOD75726.1 PhzF family phenazine biosynthesis isomerase [Ruegeria sp. HKCCD4332]NOD88963.1 PhzF family phenazine biosynthesis isomerase [Ruegeria sp. HKCCD4318]NOE14451.1 PhzF family phenazine biosynthesis isomerase [Ruegeria sp. HKCCD4318-2]NOG10028.1 PhzF family phenazine biosynthesis protein [Ruegeria sp. HKCCD4315]
MSWFEFDWVDAFSDRAFGGNGCAVVHDGAHLPEQVCMAYVRETSLVECTFSGPSDVADIRVRYFLASREIPFAGHPTIATVAAMRSRGMIEGESLTLETGAGVVSIRLTGDEIEMTQVAPQFGAHVPVDLVASTIGLPESAIISPPQFVSTGLPFCITVLRDHEALRAAQLVEGPLRKVAEAAGFSGSDMAEPFLVTLEGATDAGDTFSRLLLAPPSPPEDPFTGSATGAMAAYLWKYGLMSKDSFVAEQGHDMGRPGQATVTRVGPTDGMTGIKVAGRGHVLMRGQVDLPTNE